MTVFEKYCGLVFSLVHDQWMTNLSQNVKLEDVLICSSYHTLRLPAREICPHDLALLTSAQGVDSPLIPLSPDKLTFGQLWMRPLTDHRLTII